MPVFGFGKPFRLALEGVGLVPGRFVGETAMMELGVFGLGAFDPFRNVGAGVS